uniref:Uncharacterized protein n=1 Tax=Arundo donax TaxID=35708 RepID=A0A0A9FDZ2_ARUDO
MNHWAGLKNKKLKPHLVRGWLEQFPYMPNDPLIAKNGDFGTIKSGQNSSTNIQVSPDLPVRPKLEKGLTEAGRNLSTVKGKGSDSAHSKGTVAHLVNVCQNVEKQIARSNWPLVTKESVDQVSFTAANFPKSQQKEDVTDFLVVPPISVNGELTPVSNLLPSNDHSDEICSSADSESEKPNQQ